MELTDLVFEKNYFRYRDGFYYQNKGVAMGNLLAPSVAILFMNKLEEQIILHPQVNPFPPSNYIFFGALLMIVSYYLRRNLCWNVFSNGLISFTQLLISLLTVIDI